jgi:hypothetical protein
MSILDKFDSIEIKTDKRISERDLLFCETYQQAYDEARMALTDLKSRWSAAIRIQREILGKSGTDKSAPLPYIGGSGKITLSDMKDQLEELPQSLIHIIVSHFNSTYNVSVSCEQVESVLLPQKPTASGWNRDEEAQKKYHKALQTLALRYEDIVDQIIIQLDGRSFSERALDELKEKCHKAAWNSYRKEADYEVKNDTIRFAGYACKFESWFGNEKWELRDSLKAILYGVAHFETNSYSFFPLGFSELLSWISVEYSTVEFSTTKKIKQLRMFKNGRVDLKFANAQLAGQFAEEYLGLVY